MLQQSAVHTVKMLMDVPDKVEVVRVLVAVKHREFQHPPCRAFGLVKELLQVFHGVVCKVKRSHIISDVGATLKC